MVREELSHLKSGLVIAVSKNVEVRQKSHAYFLLVCIKLTIVL